MPTATPTAAIPPRSPDRLRVWRGLRAMRELIADPDDTALAQNFSLAVGGRSEEWRFQRFARSANGTRLLASGARVWRGSMVGGAIAHLGLFWIAADALPHAIVLTALVGFSAGSAGSVGPSLLADLIDVDEAETRERSDGVYFAVWEFVEKTAGAFIVVFVAASLQISGFEANASQAAGADFAIRFCLSLFPAAMLLAASACLRTRPELG